MDKVVDNGQVAVLYSPGFGAGWSTWINEGADRERAVFCPELVNAILDGASLDQLQEIAGEVFPYEYLGGLRDIEIKWIAEGTRFEIREYDGSESVRILAPDDGYLA